jgi:hypothetical protein
MQMQESLVQVVSQQPASAHFLKRTLQLNLPSEASLHDRLDFSKAGKYFPEKSTKDKSNPEPLSDLPL